MFSYKTLSIITSVIALSLCAVLLVYPSLLFWIFGIEETSSALFVGRRLAMLFLGFCVLTWCSRNAPHSDTRQAICVSISVAMLCMAVLGVVEYVRGLAGPGISLAVFTEAALAIGYFKIGLAGKSSHTT